MYISILDNLVAFEKLLDLFLSFCCFIFRRITHSITHIDSFHERCFDCGKPVGEGQPPHRGSLDHIAPLLLLKTRHSHSFVKSAMIVVSGLFLHIPGAIDKLLDPQLVNAVLAQMVVDDFFFDQFQNLPVIV